MGARMPPGTGLGPSAGRGVVRCAAAVDERPQIPTAATTSAACRAKLSLLIRSLLIRPPAGPSGLNGGVPQQTRMGCADVTRGAGGTKVVRLLRRRRDPRVARHPIFVRREQEHHPTVGDL